MEFFRVLFKVVAALVTFGFSRFLFVEETDLQSGTPIGQGETAGRDSGSGASSVVPNWLDRPSNFAHHLPRIGMLFCLDSSSDDVD